MKNIIVITIIAFFLVSTNSRKKTISISILNREIKNKDSIQVKIINESSQSYFIPINLDLYKYSNYIEDERLKGFFFRYVILEGNKEINTFRTRKSNCLDSIYSIEDNINYFTDRKIKSFFLKKGGFIELKIPFNDTIKYEKCNNIEYYNFNKNKKYYLQLEYFIINSSMIELLTVKNKNLKNKFYTEKILSNKVPIKIIE